MSGRSVRISGGGTPGPGEAAAIAAVLAALAGEGEEKPPRPGAIRWRLSGLLGREVPPWMSLEGPVWAYRSWEGRG